MVVDSNETVEYSDVTFKPMKNQVNNDTRLAEDPYEWENDSEWSQDTFDEDEEDEKETKSEKVTV